MRADRAGRQGCTYHGEVSGGCHHSRGATRGYHWRVQEQAQEPGSSGTVRGTRICIGSGGENCEVSGIFYFRLPNHLEVAVEVAGIQRQQKRGKPDGLTSCFVWWR